MLDEAAQTVIANHFGDGAQTLNVLLGDGQKAGRIDRGFSAV